MLPDIEKVSFTWLFGTASRGALLVAFVAFWRSPAKHSHMKTAFEAKTSQNVVKPKPQKYDLFLASFLEKP